MESEYLCYMIATRGYTHTYVGITHDMKKRLRQHNGEIVGGAKATSRFHDWEVAFYVTGFGSKNEVLSFEWRMHHPDGKRKKDRSYFGVLGRVRGLLETLIQNRFEERDFLLHATEKFQNFVQSRDPELWTALCGTIQITSLPYPVPSSSLSPTSFPPPCPDQTPPADHAPDNPPE
jgi:predicted GIY-YIG superfamily endonuclease